MADSPRVAVLQFGYPLFNNPSIINFAQVMAEHGYEVDVFTDSAQPAHYVAGDWPSIHVHVLGVPVWEREGSGGHGGAHREGRLKRVLRWLVPAALYSRLSEVRKEVLWFAQLARYARQCRRTLPSRRRTVFVASEVYGLAVACAIAGRRPIAYWSFELNPWHEARDIHLRLMRWLEWLCHRRARFTVIQDRERARCLAAADGVDPATFVIVPSTARGRSRCEPDDYLRNKLGIAPEQKIALYAGTIADWALCEELARAAERWPAHWVLVLHGWGGGQYLRNIQAIAERSPQVFVSLDFVPLSELDRIVRGADAGLALYRERNTNSRLIASASNKMGHYLRCGVPTITSDFPALLALAHEWQCTIPVSSAEEVAAALRTLERDEDGFRARAARCYDAVYDFDRYIGQVVERIDVLAR
jgi:glycosyltransferase involved in cell wall biosynthesis